MTTPAKPTVSMRTCAIASSTDWMLSVPPTRRVTSISAWTRRMAWTSSMDTSISSAVRARGEALWPDRLPGFGHPRAVAGRPFVPREAPLARLAPARVGLGLLELSPQRAQQGPGDEEARDDEQRDPDREVHVEPVGLADVGVRRAEAEHEQHQPVQQEQAADDAADVEKVRRALLAPRPAFRLGRLGLVDQLVAGPVLGGHGSLPPLDEEHAREHGEREHHEGEELRRAVPPPLPPRQALLLRGHAVHEPLELLDRLGLGHERHS